VAGARGAAALGFPMDGGEDRTFKANFTGEGVTMLQDRVKEKLRELMGDYSDDTLAVSAPLPFPTPRHDTRSVAKTLASHMPSVECGSIADGARLSGFCGIAFRIAHLVLPFFSIVGCGHVMGFSVGYVLRRLEAHDPLPHSTFYILDCVVGIAGIWLPMQSATLCSRGK
jgi:hypothetical protein